MKNVWKIIAVFSILSVFGCNYPTPRMACKEDLEVYSEACLGNLVLGSKYKSSNSESIALLACAIYVEKKKQCNSALY